MKKLATLVFALLLGASLSFAQADKPKGDDSKKSDNGDKDKKGKKAHKGGKKSKKGSPSTTPPPK